MSVLKKVTIETAILKYLCSLADLYLRSLVLLGGRRRCRGATSVQLRVGVSARVEAGRRHPTRVAAACTNTSPARRHCFMPGLAEPGVSAACLTLPFLFFSPLFFRVSSFLLRVPPFLLPRLRSLGRRGSRDGFQGAAGGGRGDR